MEKTDYEKRLNILNEELKDAPDQESKDLILMEIEELIKSAAAAGYSINLGAIVATSDLGTIVATRTNSTNDDTSMKQRIKSYFAEIKEDKFTKVKSIKCKHEIEWKGKDLENKFMLTKNSNSNTLSMGIDYRHKDDVDSVFFGFTYSNSFYLL